MKPKLYFDGTGGQDTEFMGLAGIAAPTDTWSAFEREWTAVLKEFGVPYSHMVELNGSRSPFEYGWEMDRKLDFLNRLLGVLYQRLLNRPQVCARVTTISVAQYRNIAEQYPEYLPGIRCICAFWCLTEMCNGYRQGEHFEIVFDRGESYLHEIKRHWQKREIVKEDTRLRRIDSLESGDMDTTLPLQAADLLAWEVNRYWGMTHEPATDERRFKTRFGNLEAERLILSTENKRWESAHLEHLAQCIKTPVSPGAKEVADVYRLCRVHY